VAAPHSIVRVAGSGGAGISGDDGPATAAELNSPVGLAATSDGGFLIVDNLGAVVRKVSVSGTITRVAGTGIPGHTGDDGPATDAQLGFPSGIAATSDGGFLITAFARSRHPA
jgi:DNA-binding beta-propeller fold protein YncE